MNLYYGKFHALKNINMEIPEKEITAFIGPSGCGKSTLLKLLMRFWDADSGEVSVNGANVRGIPTRSLRKLCNTGNTFIS